MRSREPVEVPAITYPPGTVLNIDHVARWLGIGVRTVEQLDIPCIMIGPRTKRYLSDDVILYLAKKSKGQNAA